MARFLQVNDRIGVVVEYAFTQELEGFVETITCPRGSERGHENVEVGVDARLVDPGVQGGVVDVVDLLTRCHVMVQLDGIGASSTEGVTGVERVHELQGIHVRLDVGRGLFEAGPLAFPHFNDVVP